MIKDPPTDHKRTKKVYSKLSFKTKAQIKSRDDEVLLAQLRSGKHKTFEDYKLKLEPNADTCCPLCKAPDYTLTHWLTKCKNDNQHIAIVWAYKLWLKPGDISPSLNDPRWREKL